MAWSEETWWTLIKLGIKSKDGHIYRADRYKQVYWSGTTPGLDNILSVTLSPITHLGGYWTDYLPSAYNDIIYVPPEPVYKQDEPNFPQGIAYVKFIKNAGEDRGRIAYFNEQDVEVYSDQIGYNQPAPRPNTDYTLGTVTNNDLYLIIGCWQNWSETTFSAGWAITGSIDPTMQDHYAILKAWDFCCVPYMSGESMNLLDAWLYNKYWDPVGNAGIPDPNGGDPEGGQGDWRSPDEDVPMPPLPTKSAAASGFMRIYNISAQELNALATELWDPTFEQSIIKNFQSPFENIISLAIVPYAGFTGSSEPVQIGNYKANVVADALDNTYYQIDCGNIELNNYYDTFADYDGYTEMQLVLPYCTTIPISPTEFVGGSINVMYNFDVFSGACVAGVLAIKDGHTRLMYMAQGNIKTDLPINGQNYMRVYTEAVGSVFQLAGGLTAAGGAIAGGNLAKGIGGGLGAVGGAIKEAANIKPEYQRAGSAGATHGLMGMQHPYLIIKRPRMWIPEGYREDHGYVSNKAVRVGDEEGYLQSDVSFNALRGILCTDKERDLIKQAFSRGIYI